MLEILRDNIDSPSCEHVLLVAPRGRGKTTLPARVAAELRTDTELSGRLFPIRFIEESQEIFNLADFWLETLFYLARESTQCDPELSRELQDTHTGLAGEWRGENLEERARAAVLEAADRIGMKLVLMVENLQALCECVDEDFGWKLRGALQTDRGCFAPASWGVCTCAGGGTGGGRRYIGKQIDAKMGTVDAGDPAAPST